MLYVAAYIYLCMETLARRLIFSNPLCHDDAALNTGTWYKFEYLCFGEKIDLVIGSKGVRYNRITVLRRQYPSDKASSILVP